MDAMAHVSPVPLRTATARGPRQALDFDTAVIRVTLKTPLAVAVAVRIRARY